MKLSIRLISKMYEFLWCEFLQLNLLRTDQKKGASPVIKLNDYILMTVKMIQLLTF